MSVLSNFDVVPIPEEISCLRTRDSFRFLKINKIVYDKNENTLDKLSNVYNALDNINSSLVMILESNGEQVDLYIGIKTARNSIDPTVAKNVLQKSFKGNFPGSNLLNLSNDKIDNIIKKITESKYQDKERIVSSVSGVPSMKDDKNNFVQGLEKLIDAMQGEKFSAIFISDSIKNNQIEKIKMGYENIYSQLSPFSKNNLSFSINESETVTEGLTKGFTETINKSLTQTQNYTLGSSETMGDSKNTSQTKSSGAMVGTAIGGVVGFFAGGPIGGAVVGGLLGRAITGSSTEGKTTNFSKTKNSSVTSGNSQTYGESNSKSLQKTKQEAKTVGSTKSLQITREEKTVSNLLDKIDDQLKRLKESQDYGMWNSSCYFLADDPHTANIAASTYKSLMRGEESAIESAFVNSWTNDNKENLLKVKKYLKKLSHPLIDLNITNILDAPYVTPGSLISGKELTIQMGLPLKSVKGVTVMETAEFGRNILSNKKVSADEKLNLGKFYHMGKTEKNNVELDIDSLKMHTFITGSTGAGKSNTIYQILSELDKKNKKFLVIEPAKGEYKKIFGGRENVNVFGTNPEFTDLLKINPFKFPENIHVLEHIDRLVEIFNACWPMYAAMPAVLKNAIEKTYKRKGWNLKKSFYFGKVNVYPDFKDLLEVLPIVINKSAYSQDLKSDYTGALLTRIKSLTNGLVGNIFVKEEIDNDKLFNENCIIDISRIGSMETKSLLMGIVFMKLQEERYSNGNSNSELKHLTVLEEAHNLLRKSSFTQNQESSNLQGKSVEMISNAIAEMRTFGEGFIIADQTPDMLDSSVIKNTNTKIILRLPDENDRNLVGKAANLNEDQITELSKLETGVAAVYQNDWLEPILSKINEFTDQTPLKYINNLKEKENVDKKNRSDLVKLFLNCRITKDNRVSIENLDLNNLKRWIRNYDLNNYLKKEINNIITEYQKNKQYEELNNLEIKDYEKLSRIISSFFDCEDLISFANYSSNINDWNEKLRTGIRNYIDLEQNIEFENTLIKTLLRSKAKSNENLKKLYFGWVKNIEGGEKLR